MTPSALMIFAAGHGTRMRPLTDTLPKPLIEVGGIAMIDRVLEQAGNVGISRITVNTHYLGEKIAAHLADRRDIAISHEPGRALETGGGLKRALPLVGPDPLFTVNPDAVWTGRNPFAQLARHWNPRIMDALLLVVAARDAAGHDGGSDFRLDAEGRVSRHDGTGPPGHVYTGAQILKTEGLHRITDAIFSLNRLWDDMIAEGRLFACLHDGKWAAVGTPGAIPVAEDLLRGATDV
jgi:MurNAc alpha-1-phosphate uridylyltransferase